MCFAAIDPYGKTREGVAVEGMGRIRNRHFTRQLFKEWGISLYLIPENTDAVLASLERCPDTSKRYRLFIIGIL